MWILSLGFEVGLLALFAKRCHAPLANPTLDPTQICLAALRILFLLLMLAMFLITGQDSKSRSKNTPQETESLLNANGNANGNDRTAYGTSQNKLKGNTPVRIGDAQSTTWLDYVVGFQKLFPFLWQDLHSFLLIHLR